MGASDLATLAPIFEELHGVYVVLPIDWVSYSQYTKVVVDIAVRELLAHDEFY